MCKECKVEYCRGRNEGYENGRKNCDCDSCIPFFIGFILAAVIVIGVFALIFAGDSNDRIDTENLGKILCKQKGMEYSHREIFNEKPNDGIGPLPRIYCENKENPKRLIDGVLLEV